MHTYAKHKLSDVSPPLLSVYAFSPSSSSSSVRSVTYPAPSSTTTLLSGIWSTILSASRSRISISSCVR